jgi:peptide/nickel transport system ATP-binding protein
VGGTDQPPVLELEDVAVAYRTRRGEVRALGGVSLRLGPGEALGLVGESGSGKSTLAFAVMRHLGPAGRLVRGRVLLEGRDVYAMGARELRALRGGRMAMVYQDPTSSLNPVMTVWRQLREVAVLHAGATGASARARVLEMLAAVRLPDPAALLERYPHELSGGQQQRVVIAMALLANPALLVLDEPTTALDVRVQAEILDLLADLRRRFDAAILYISHDLGTVTRICERVAVMQAGRIVETGPLERVFTRPQHPHTRTLLQALPRIDDPLRAATDMAEQGPALALQSLRKTYVDGGGPIGGGRREVRALGDVSLLVRRGRTLAVVGESGSGKSTLAKLLLGIESPDSGTITLAGGFELAGLPVDRRPPEILARLQMVFQNPDGTLNPSHTVGYALARPLRLLGKARGDVARQVVLLLDAVRLPADFALRRPHQLSGGQKQRVAIARALASSPEIIVADEPTSALDVSVQARVIELLGRIRGVRELTLVFISHDLALVRSFADDVAVIHEGEVVEHGTVLEVFSPPHHPYTLSLIRAVPRVPAGDQGTGQSPSR